MISPLQIVRAATMCILPLALFLPPAPAASPTWKKSWIEMEPISPGLYSEGDTIEVSVRYHLAPEDTVGSLRLAIQPLGPRGAPGSTPVHRDYEGMTTQSIAISSGEGAHTFRFQVRKLHPRNDLNFTAYFTSNGKRWPLPWSYDTRHTSYPLRDPIRLEPRLPFYTLATAQPANLFTWDEPVRVSIVFREGTTPGERHTLRYRLYDASGNETSGTVDFDAGRPGEHTEVIIPAERRGIFALETSVEGWGERELVFARIPDVPALTNDARTHFGGTDLWSEEQNQIARRLGLTFSRHLGFNWAKAQPSPDRWELEAWDRILATNRRHGIDASIAIVHPPLWVMPDGVHGAGYEPFPFDRKAWQESIQFLATRWADRLHGFEWLNEITPGKRTTDPVGDYLDFCRIGTDAARTHAPRLQTQLAGGLWPRNFRQDVLRAGIAAHVDILPVHYSDESGVLDARDDLIAAGATAAPDGRVILWDNEGAHPVWVPLDMPWREAIRDRSQSEWVLRRWPGELVAGAQRIIYFGGFYSLAAGGWNYLIDDNKPRPVAVTLAVQSAKLGLARPLGRIPLGKLGVAYLFENAGRPVAVASTQNTDGETVTLDLASPSAETESAVLLTDYQGNETTHPLSNGGRLELKLNTLPVFIEGASLDAWRSHVSLRVGDARGQARFVQPHGSGLHVPVEVANPFGHSLPVTLALRPPAGWPQPDRVPLTIPAGEIRRVSLALAIPPQTPPGRIALEVEATFATTSVTARQSVTLDVIDPSTIGNLLKNPGFEKIGPRPERAAQWSADANVRRETVSETDALTPGLGRHVIVATGLSDKWGHVTQQIQVFPGQSYLYSLWVRTENIAAGSNVTLHLNDGSRRTLAINRIFRAPRTSPWRIEHVRLDMPPDVASISVTPVANGPGNASFDNISLSLYEGASWSAFASKTRQAPQIDGRLDDWDFAHLTPIPLLADNQLTVLNDRYQWSPENLSGAAWFRWDATGLYLAARIRDDRHHTVSDETRLSEGDSLAIALHPANRTPGEDHRAFTYIVSDALPGAGGGKHTLYRDSNHAGGLASGHLARDSSVYKLAIRRDDSARITDYELFMPWSELGGIVPEPGVKLGLSILLNDNDGGERRSAAMTWGRGLHPQWEPARFGILTLVNDTE